MHRMCMILIRVWHEHLQILLMKECQQLKSPRREGNFTINSAFSQKANLHYVWCFETKMLGAANVSALGIWIMK